LLAAAAALIPAGRLRAQDVTFSAGVDVVNVLVGVRNKNGEIVRDLRQSDFKIEEDGRPQTVKYFSHESDLALTLGLLIDTSGSQRYVLNEERQASLQFLRSVMRENKDMAFVLHFAAEVELLQDLTSSRAALRAALDDPMIAGAPPRRGGSGKGPRMPLPLSRGGTSLYDAILLASDELMRKQPGRKAVIVLSDGVDQGSRVSLSRSIEAAQRADTLVYSILFSGTPAAPPIRIVFGPWGAPGSPPIASSRRVRTSGGKVLERISRETGGRYFEVTNKTPLHEIYAGLEQELRSQYNLGYTPDRPKQGYRRIKVSVARRGLTVQAREGYYAD
jgi:VWFA-related protein